MYVCLECSLHKYSLIKQEIYRPLMKSSSMASSSSSFLKCLEINYILLVSLLLAPTLKFAHGSCDQRFTSIISFGDSLADTGNLLHLSSTNDPPPHFALPPYGETYFHGPTGRCSDGRLIVDFIAQYLGIPLLPPYIGVKNGTSTINFHAGVNFAVAGATALDKPFFEEKGIHIPVRNASLGIQLGWFKDLLQSFCQASSSDCQELVQSSLILVGEIGGNDYNHAFLAGVSKEVIQTFVAPVVDAIASTINELLDMGALTLIVPGNLPIGCSTAYLTYFMTSDKEEYDPQTGCLIWLNKFAEYHNTLLQTELTQIQALHPHANIIYADYYNAAMPLFLDPKKFGFSRGAVTACCGGIGPYNYNSSVECGKPPSTVCEEPSLFVNWDGLHLTEAAYRWIFKGLFEGSYTVPQFSNLCKKSQYL